MDYTWIKYCAVGELLGFAAAAAFNIIHLVFIGEPSNLFSAFGILILATIGGVAEGSILAWFQWQRLKDYVPDLKLSLWIKYTALIAALGWLIGMSFPTFGGLSNEEASNVDDPSIWLIALLGIGMGIALGALFGFVQSIPLRELVTNPNSWISANILAWSVAMTFLMIGPSSMPAGVSIFWIIVIAMSCGFLAGISIGFITMYFVRNLDPR